MSNSLPDDFATESEALFASYLDSLALTYRYEPEGREGMSNPDFWVETETSEIVCEVTELEWFLPSLPEGTRTGVWLDTYGGIRRKLQDKHKQGRHLKGQHPYVVVLRFKTPHPAVSTIVPGAMYGNVAISIPIDPSGGPPPAAPARNVFASGGRLQPNRLTTISAVAVVGSLNPTVAAVEERIQERLTGNETTEEGAAIIIEEYAKPDYDAGARSPRLDTFHNVFASDPRLPLNLFAGPLDREFDRADDFYTEVFRGADYDKFVGQV